MRTLAFGLIATAGVAVGSLPASAQTYWSTGIEPRTTRIEPRPVYGAIVTLEAGVRVFRPLPPHDRIIINPGNATPLYMGVGDAPVRRSYIDGYRR
jgi:hypothetical protein